jgi:hypothetical protein
LLGRQAEGRKRRNERRKIQLRLRGEFIFITLQDNEPIGYLFTPLESPAIYGGDNIG